VRGKWKLFLAAANGTQGNPIQQKALENMGNQDQNEANSQDKNLRSFRTDNPESGVLMNDRPPLSGGKNQPYHQHDRSSQVERQKSAPENKSRQFVA
jgi:hypothetical protein